MLTDYHATNESLGHRSVTYEHEGKILGFAYYADANGRSYMVLVLDCCDSPREARGIGGKHVSTLRMTFAGWVVGFCSSKLRRCLTSG